MTELDEITRNLKNIRGAVDLIKSLAEDRERWAVTVDEVGESLVDSLTTTSEVLERMSSTFRTLEDILPAVIAETGQRLSEFHLLADVLGRELKTTTQRLNLGKEVSDALGFVAGRLDSAEEKIGRLQASIDSLTAAQSSTKSSLDQLRSRQSEIEKNIRLLIREELDKSSRRLMGALDSVVELMTRMEASSRRRRPLSVRRLKDS